ncbi:5419_t:CDS:2, partial [Entrophospora sp. SA101]
MNIQCCDYVYGTSFGEDIHPSSQSHQNARIGFKEGGRKTFETAKRFLEHQEFATKKMLTPIQMGDIKECHMKTSNSLPNFTPDLDKSYEIVNPVENKIIQKSFIDEEDEDDNLSSDDDLSTTSSESSDYTGKLIEGNKADTPSQRIAKVRDFKRKNISSLTSFRVIYMGEDVPNTCKHGVFSKLCESLGQYFLDEVKKPITQEISDEKRYVLCPATNLPMPNNTVYEYYTDSGVSVYEIDLTNKSLTEAKDNLFKTHFKIDSIDDDDGDGNDGEEDESSNQHLFDLCVVFIPPDLARFPSFLIKTMQELQKFVTLLPIISLYGQELIFNHEKDQKRKDILRHLENNKIEMFVWRADNMAEDLDKKGKPTGKFIETNYSNKLLTIDDFSMLSSEKVYHDMQILRARAIQFRKEHKSMAELKKRSKRIDNKVKLGRKISIVITAILIAYLSIFIMANFAQWTLIPADLASSLGTVSKANLGHDDDIIISNNHNINEFFSQYKTLSKYIRIWQTSSNKFEFDIIKPFNSKITKELNVILYYDKQKSIRKQAKIIGKNHYSFEINGEDSANNSIKKNGSKILIKIVDKNGVVIKEFEWPKDIEKQNNDKSIELKKLSHKALNKNEDNGIISNKNNYNYLYGFGSENSVVNLVTEGILINVRKATSLAVNLTQETFLYISENLKFWIPFAFEKVRNIWNISEILENVKSWFHTQISHMNRSLFNSCNVLLLVLHQLSNDHRDIYKEKSNFRRIANTAKLKAEKEDLIEELQNLQNEITELKKKGKRDPYNVFNNKMT